MLAARRRISRTGAVAAALLGFATPAAATVIKYDVQAQWQAAVASQRAIDLTTPSGTCGAFLSETCNFGDQGAIFQARPDAPYFPDFYVRYGDQGVRVSQVNPFSNESPELNVYFPTPVLALAAQDVFSNCFAACNTSAFNVSSIAAFDSQGNQLLAGRLGYDFVGLVSDVPIARIQITSTHGPPIGVGLPDVYVTSFWFGAVPEPSTFALLAAGFAVLSLRRRLA